MEEDGRHVRFDHELYRPHTVLDGIDIQQQNEEGSNLVDSGRRRSSSDPSGRGRQRPRLAVLRPRGNAQGTTAMAHIPEDARIGSTAFFNAPGGRNEVKPELADVLDVIGA